MRNALLVCATLVFMAAGPLAVNAQNPTNYTVNSLGDAPAANPAAGTGLTAAGDITLRSAMMAANVDGAPSVIDFAFSLVAEGPAEVLVGSTLPTVTSTMGIYGRGADLLTVRSGGVRIFSSLGSQEFTLSSLTITGSTQGAVLNNNSVLVVRECVLRDNNGIATGLIGGGAIDNRGGGQLFIHDSIIGPNNTATFSGAIDNFVGPSNLLFVLNSTFIGNRASDAGGVLYNGESGNSATFLNCTFTGNSAGDDGGVLYQDGSLGGLTIVNSTIVGNSADGFSGGIYTFESTTTLLINTIVAQNTEEGNVEVNIDGTVSGDSEHNFIGENQYLEGISHGINGNQIGTPGAPINPQLGVLDDNGGPVPTMLPLDGSPVIDTGTEEIPAIMAGWNVTIDARGLARLSGPAVDIGAVEIQADAPVIPGDYNGDGVVNVKDVTVLAAHVLAGVPLPVDLDPDYNGDGVVDINDPQKLAADIADGTVGEP